MMRNKKLELECAERDFEHSSEHFQKTVIAMRDAADEVSRAAKRLTAARKAIAKAPQKRPKP